MRTRTLVASFLILLVAVASTFAQTETGQITGTVLDQTAAAVPNATVTAKSIGTGVTRTATTGAAGTYSLTNLLPGEYSVSVSASGFAALEQRVSVAVGARVGLDLHLEVGKSETIVEVSEAAVQIDTATQTLGEVISQTQMRELPNLTRNPYQFVAFAGNVSDAGMGTRGAGFNINGQRESSTNILLDGGSNNDEFGGSIGQQIPLDSVQEFSILTSNFTAEYGRASGGIVNVVTKSGNNDYHGTAYEFNRASRLSSNSFQNNANGVPKSVFVRNNFGYSFGGPIKRNKLFFWSNTEWTRVRSAAEGFAWVPTPDVISQFPANSQAFFQAYGQLRSNASSLGTVSRNDLLNLLGKDPCAGLGCAALPMTLPLFNHVAYNVPTDAGGGYPQNTYDTFNRVDYNLSDKTQVYGHYALYSELDQAGVVSSSPYNNYDLAQTYFNHNFLFSVIHVFSPNWLSQSKVVFNRLTNLQQGITSRGVVPTMYPNTSGAVSIGSDNIAFPGYNPFTPGNGGAFGGPQNLLQFYQDVSYTHGTHALRFGGTYEYIRDNRTYAAYQTAVDALALHGGGIGPALSALMAGQFAEIKAAIDPQGHFPCVGGVVTPDCEVTLPVSQPSFSRSNRYHESALYAQDAWKIRPRITINLGVRWEFFGPQHNKNAKLDANWYDPGLGFSDNNIGQYLRNGTMQIAPNSSIGELWKPSWHNFGPRIGVAWDVFGDGKTSVRGGYGISYERNFGNVTFNLIQNPPNYAVLDVKGDSPITTSNFGPLSGSGGTFKLPRVGGRIVDPNIKTAYAHTWNTAIEHRFGRATVWSIEYSGSKGVNLYSIDYPNQNGFGNLALGDPCDASGCSTQPNANWGVNIGYRGNQGFSIYHALNNRIKLANFLNSGVDLVMNYTYAHAIDNLSSTFFEAAGIASQYGNANITINNGNYVYGLLDPYHPNLDRGDAEFDIRHRVTLAGNWKIPFGNRSGIYNRILGGWSLNPLFSARTGQPFSIFDSSVSNLPLNTQRASFDGTAPNKTLTATGLPDSYNFLTFSNSQILRVPMTFAPGAAWPSSMSGRDAFRAPGWWDFDLGLYKDTKLTERFSLQLRLETFNLFNHANLYVNGNSADMGAGNTVNSCYGCTGSTFDRRHVQLAAKIIW